MNLQTVVAAVGVLLVLFVFLAIWAGRYTKVGPNQALVISGRQRILPNGQKVGVRFITGGGTFVLPVIEQVAVLSLDVIAIKLRRLTISTAPQGRAEIDCVAQVKIKSDEASLNLAAEYFLNKKPEEITAIMNDFLEQELRVLASTTTLLELPRDLESLRSKGEIATAAQLEKMGVKLLTLRLENVSTSSSV